MTVLHDRTPIIEAALLGQLVDRPGGDPELVRHMYTSRVVQKGWAYWDSDGTTHLTADGWYALGSHRQTRVWHAAVTEYAQRQGPADAPLLRRLVLEHACAEAAFRHLAALGQAAAAEQIAYEATLIKARLAVLTGVPVRDMDEVAVMLMAEELAEELDRLAQDGYPHAWVVDPGERMVGVKACRNGGGLIRRRWEVPTRGMLEALLVS